MDRIRQSVFDGLHNFIQEGAAIASPLPDWMTAYDYSGRYSTFSRAQAIKGIVEEAAPVPSEAMSREVADFLRDLRILVCGSIKAAGGILTSDVEDNPVSVD